MTWHLVEGGGWRRGAFLVGVDVEHGLCLNVGGGDFVGVIMFFLGKVLILEVKRRCLWV